MAITYEKYQRLPASGLSTSKPVTASYTQTSGACLLVLMIAYAGTTLRTGGAPTYKKVSFTQADSARCYLGGECTVETWYLLNSGITGSNTVSIPNDGALSLMAIIADATTGSGYAGFDVASGRSALGTNPYASVTTTKGNTLIFAHVAFQYYDKAAAGAQTLSWTESTSDDYGAIAAAFYELAGTTSSLSSYLKGRDQSNGQNSAYLSGKVSLTSSNLQCYLTGQVAGSNQRWQILS